MPQRVLIDYTEPHNVIGSLSLSCGFERKIYTSNINSDGKNVDFSRAQSVQSISICGSKILNKTMVKSELIKLFGQFADLNSLIAIEQLFVH